MNINTSTSIFGIDYANSTYKNSTNKGFKKRIGLGFPFYRSPKNGYFQKVSGKELIKMCVRQLLLIEQGERLMMPLYGAGLKRFLGEPLDNFLIEDIKDTIVYNITKYMPLVSIVKIDISQPESASTELSQINIYLIVKIKEEVDSTVEVEISL